MTQNASQKSSGHKNREVGWTKFKFGQLILRKIIKIVATRCHILRVKCTKFHLGWGSAPDPAGGAQNALPDPLAEFKGPPSNGRVGREWKRGREKGDKRGSVEKNGGGGWKGASWLCGMDAPGIRISKKFLAASQPTGAGMRWRGKARRG